jgi:proline iminopeptidase
MNSGCRDIEPLAGGRTLITYDQRGGGRSDIVTDPKLLTAAAHVRDLEAMKQHFQINQMTLIGFSWGAGLAALYTADHPQAVKRLLLIAPLPPAKKPFWDERTAKINALIGSRGVARMNEIRERLPKASDEEAGRRASRRDVCVRFARR